MMTRTLWIASAVLAAAFINSVPSKAALHPQVARCGLNEGDLSGSGREVEQERPARANSRGERPEAAVAREWRALAARCRSLAEWQNDGAREILLRMAAEYETRADHAERAPEG
jgi:hypothetical protein